MAKEEKKNKSSPKKAESYKIEGNRVVRLKKSCPRCGSGTLMAKHKGRLYCGRCHYTIFEEKKAAKEPNKDKKGK